MHICKYHLKDANCYLKNMCKVKHPSISWNYRGNTVKEFLCRNYFVISLEKLFWIIMDEWFGFRMIWQILLLNRYLITSTALGICLYHSPSSFGRGPPRTYLLSSNYKHNCLFVSTGPSGLLKTISGTMCSRFTPTHTLQQVQHRDRLQSSETRLGKSSQLHLSLEFFISSESSQLQGQFSLSVYHLNGVFGQMELHFFIQPYHLIRFVDLLTEGDEN